MKKVFVVAMCIFAFVGSFFLGRMSALQTEKRIIADIEWAAMESCNMKIKSMNKGR